MGRVAILTQGRDAHDTRCMCGRMSAIRWRLIGPKFWRRVQIKGHKVTLWQFCFCFCGTASSLPLTIQSTHVIKDIHGVPSHGMVGVRNSSSQVGEKTKTGVLVCPRAVLHLFEVFAKVWMNMQQLGNDPQDWLEWIHTKYGPRPHTEPNLKILGRIALYCPVGGHPLETQCFVGRIPQLAIAQLLDDNDHGTLQWDFHKCQPCNTDSNGEVVTSAKKSVNLMRACSHTGYAINTSGSTGTRTILKRWYTWILEFVKNQPFATLNLTSLASTPFSHSVNECIIFWILDFLQQVESFYGPNTLTFLALEKLI